MAIDGIVTRPAPAAWGRTVARRRFERPVVTTVIEQHVDDCSVLIEARAHLVVDPNVGLVEIERRDERIAAHLDALVVGGTAARTIAEAGLGTPGPGNTCVVAVLAMLARDDGAIERVLALAEAHEPAAVGVIAAFGWVPADHLRGVVRRLLEAPGPVRRRMGLRACAAHGVDAGPAIDAALCMADASVRREALRLSSDLGLVARLPTCLASLDDVDPGCRFEAARSAVLLGDRDEALRVLLDVATHAGASQSPAVVTVLKVLDTSRSRALLERLFQAPSQIELFIRGIGLGGDPHFVPWLIEQMDDPQRCRLACDAFAVMLGADRADLAHEAGSAVVERAGQMDDPDDDDVSMREDDAFVMPDPRRVVAWWDAHRAGFVAGRRYFAGRSPTVAHCRSVLVSGLQRERRIAAELLCLLSPGTAHFDIAAPARRQRRLIDAGMDR